MPVSARFCPECGAAQSAPAAEPGTRGAAASLERKQVTALFADFAGFTAFVHKSDVEDVRDFMSAVWARFDSIIAAHGGVTEKHIGDAVLALFGARQAREEDPVQAVRCALAMQASLAEHPGPGVMAPPQMRIGVHTGLVVVGPLGPAGEVAATGDAVNLSNRLQQHAPIGGVAISHDTYRQVAGFFDVETLPPLELKGRSEPIPTYQVLGAKPRSVAMQLRGIEGVRTEMIGRGAEMKQLQSALQSVMQQRQSQMITIVGEAGIGKSCLIQQFQNWFDLLPQSIRLFGGRATSEMGGIPFGLMRDVLYSRFEIQETDPPEMAREKLEKGFVSLLASGERKTAEGDEDPLVQAHFIGQLLGFDYSHSPHLRELTTDPNQIRQRAFHHLSRFFSVISQGSPDVSAGVLVAEDIHWSDDGSLDLWEHLARTCSQAPLLMVCLARPALYERRPEWGQDLASHARITLEPLSRRESRSMVDSILQKTGDIPQAMRELIVGGAEGNPFFIEEIIKMLIDQQVIVPGTEQWAIQPERLVAARVPATLTGVLQARLDSLGATERAVLQRAAVVGRIFWDRAVERLSSSFEGSLSRQELLDALSGLRRKELIFRRESSAFSGAVEYTFKHELLRNVALESLLKKLRREHHAQVAGWLLEQAGVRADEFAGLIASHFEQANQFSVAADWYGRAGQQARRGYAPATAVDHFRKALALIPPGEETGPAANKMEWLENLGEMLAAQARFAEASESYKNLRSLAEEAGDKLAEARACNGLAFLDERQGNNRASIESAEHAEALARKAGQRGVKELIRALHLKGWAFYRLADAEAVLKLAEQTLTLCKESNDQQGLATSLKLLGVAHLQLGHYREADQFFEEGLARSREAGDRRTTAAMYSNLGEIARFRGDYSSAVELYEKALFIARQIGHRESELIYITNLAAARLGLNAFVQAETDLRQAIALTGGRNSCALAEAFSLLAEACLGQGKREDAFEASRRALELASESENDLYLGTAWRTLGQVLCATGASPPGNDGIPSAGDCFAESLRVFQKMNAEGEQARTLRAWAELDFQQGRLAEAAKKSEAAKTIFQRLGAEFEAARTEAIFQEPTAPQNAR
jgi:predicted ATPase/class 3 adenylate cyclase